MSRTVKIILILLAVAAVGAAVYFFVIKPKQNTKPKTSESRADFVARVTNNYLLNVKMGSDKRAVDSAGKPLTGTDLQQWAAAQANWEADQKGL